MIVIDSESEGSFEYSVCLRRGARERLLMTSRGHEVTTFTTTPTGGATGEDRLQRGGAMGEDGLQRGGATDRAMSHTAPMGRKFLIMFKSKLR